MSVKLSILIPSLTSRSSLSSRMIQRINSQVLFDPEIQVLCLVDNMHMSIGEKMNRLLDLATGEYTVCLGDDDDVAPDFVDVILGAIEEHKPDCVTYNIDYYFDNVFQYTIREGIGLPRTNNNTKYGTATHPPSAKMAIRSDIHKQFHYRPISYGEDVEFARWVDDNLKTEHHIDRSLYYYYYRSDNQEGKTMQRALGRAF